MVRDANSKTITLKGNVQLIFQQQYLGAEEAVIYLEKKQIEAKGNVQLVTPTVHAEADQMFINYQDNTGVLKNGFIISEQTSFEGRLIYKTGENEYEVVDGTFTSCENCPSAWSFKGSKIDAEFGGYAKIKNARIRMYDIPFFWMPYLIVPLKSERQSGFLTPDYSVSKNAGNTLSLKFYYVSSENSDATFTLQNYEKRGLKFKTNFRYVLSPEDKGELNFSYIPDRLFAEDYNALQSTDYEQINRWMINYTQEFKLPHNIDHKAELYLISDAQYANDFPLELEFQGASSLNNQISFTKNTDKSHSSLNVNVYRNLLFEDPLENNKDAVHRFPEINYNNKSKPFFDSSIFYNFDMKYNNFARPGVGFDKIDSSDTDRITVIDHDGSYTAGTDIIRSGQRISLEPQLYKSFLVGEYLDVLPTLRAKLTHYQFAVDSTATEENKAHQSLLEFGLRARFRLFNIYSEDNSNEQSNRLKHEIVPSIEYFRTPYLNQSEHSFLSEEDSQFLKSNIGITDGDQLQFDYYDQINLNHNIRLKFTNSWTKKTWKDNSPVYEELVNWQIYQSYDFGEDNQPLSDITNILSVNWEHWTSYTEMHYYPYVNRTNIKSNLRYKTFNNSYAILAYEKTFDIQKNQEVDDSSKTENLTLTTYLKYKSIKFGANGQYSLTEHKFSNYKLGISVQPPGNCWRFNIIANVPTTTSGTGDPTIEFKFDMTFDGKNWDSEELNALMKI